MGLVLGDYITISGLPFTTSSSPAAAPGPLTPEAVTEAVTLVTWDNLCICLRVPASKCDEIELHFLANDRQRVLVEWWLSTDPSPSWRRLIQRLDDSGDTASADKIRCNLEPVQGVFATYIAASVNLCCM